MLGKHKVAVITAAMGFLRQVFVPGSAKSCTSQNRRDVAHNSYDGPTTYCIGIIRSDCRARLTRRECPTTAGRSKKHTSGAGYDN
jgi:hypothetical protein